MNPNNNFMHPFSFRQLLLVAFLIMMATPALGQDFDEALNLYQQQEYEEAAEIFSEIDDQEAQLFAGKSYFGLGEYIKSQRYLTRAEDADDEEIVADAAYTLALTDFQLKQYDEALKKLYELQETQRNSEVGRDARNFYNDILEYLTVEQRKQAFQSITNTEIRFDLVESILGKVDYSTAKLMVRQFENSSDDGERLDELQQAISDSSQYSSRVSSDQPEAPDNITYNIGATLPEYTTEDSEFGISQGLYFGYLMAADEFNDANSDKNVTIKFNNTDAEAETIPGIMGDFAWNLQADAVLGPLYSEPAEEMAPLAESYQIPMIAPLANSDSLNIDNPYVYQANPTFAVHGKKMAEFAVNELAMDTLAVITERNSLGSSSAYSFRDEAEKRGAKVVHFFVEDLESDGYEIGEYTKYFTADTSRFENDQYKYHQLDGVYAPFTGQAASTLIDLLLVDLNSMESDLTVLGSQEWGATDIREGQLDNLEVFFSESYYQESEGEQQQEFAEAFEEQYGIEPNRFAMIGYDTATFVLKTLERVKNPALLKSALKEQPLYEGLINNIDFNGTHVNEGVKIFEYTADEIVPVDSL